MFNSFQFNLAMLIPIAGWLYILVGIIWPYEHWLFLVIFWIDVFLSVVVHAVQIFVAIPVAGFHGVSKVRAAVYTFIFGATWWRPMQLAMKAQQNRE